MQIHLNFCNNFVLHFYTYNMEYRTWKILVSHTRLWVRRKFPLKVLSLQNMNKKNSSRRVYIPIRVHLRQNCVHWKAEGKRQKKAKMRHALGNMACISTAGGQSGRRKATNIRYLLIRFLKGCIDLRTQHGTNPLSAQQDPLQHCNKQNRPC